MNLTLKVWRQKNKKDKGQFETYSVQGISSEMSFLEMFDVLNERLVVEGKEPIAFDHDCREGICGMCSMYINGRPHGPWEGTTTCQLHMRAFKDGDTIVVEPWRANAFPVFTEIYPPAWMIRSNAPRSTTRSLMIGKALARHGSSVKESPSLKNRI